MNMRGYRSGVGKICANSVFLGVVTVLITLLNAYGLILGITIVLPHLFYIPIILAAYYYPRRGTWFALVLSAFYLGMVAAFTFPGGAEILQAVARACIFVLIAVVVSFLTMRVQVSEERYRGVTERISDVILVIDLTGKAVYVSPSVQKILGYKPEELIGRPPQEFFHPEDLGLLSGNFQRSVAGEQIDGMIVRFKRRDGEYAIMDFSGAPVLHDGVLGGIQVIGRDVTAKIRAEEALQEAHRRLTDIIDHLPDPTFVIDAEGNVSAWNRAMERLTGIPAASILGKGDNAYAIWFYGRCRPVLIDMVLHEDLAAIGEQYPKYRREGRTVRVEVEFSRSDGTPLSLWLTATPLFDQDGETIGAIESLHDVTDQKAITRAWRESKRYLEAIINTISDPVFVKDRQHRWVTVNEGFCRFLGYPREAVLGRTDRDLFSSDEADVFWQKDEEVFGTQEVNENEEALTDAQGDLHTIVTKKSLYVDGSGEQFIVGIIRDITERKRAERALHEANRKLHMLSSITRHDILNQLVALRGYIELSKDSSQDAALQNYIRRADESAERIERQIEFTRYYQDIGVEAPAWQDAGSLIDSTATLLDLSGIVLENSVSGISIFADPLIGKVFYNLMENSLRHGGSVTKMGFSATSVDDRLILVFCDNGAGISDRDRQRLFQKGFGKHTGLGLFLSREILSITGITITENGMPGEGARFEITVPKGAWRSVGREDAGSG